MSEGAEKSQGCVGDRRASMIRAVEPQDEAEWRELWAAYNEFYEATIPEAVTSSTWHRIIDPQFPIHAVVAVYGNDITGFANYAILPYSWSIRPHCYLEDLFVQPERRGRGIGRALIEHLIGLCRENRWTELYWLTQEGNHTARRLYDSITSRDGYIQYTVEVE